jgi:hypothetical protein
VESNELPTKKIYLSDEERKNKKGGTRPKPQLSQTDSKRRYPLLILIKTISNKQGNILPKNNRVERQSMIS